MKKVNPPAFKLLLPAFLLFVGAAKAQKLPNVQQASVRAPANVKIDGKVNEWDDTYGAYNKATEIFYTIANDDQNLYLVVKATDYDIINKIVDGGVEFTIQKSDKKAGKDGVSITYPAYETPDNKSTFRFNFSLALPRAADSSPVLADSLMHMNNNILAQNCKSVRVSGIAGLDSLLSIYNEDGIRVAGLFDLKKAYKIEMAIALKHLSFSPLDAGKFAYHISLNGAKPKPLKHITFAVGFHGDGTRFTDVELQDMEAGVAIHEARISSPTDFWGEYTLKK